MRHLLALLVLLFGTAATPSPTAQDEATLGDVMRGLAAVAESRATFFEEKNFAALAQPLRGRGRLLYRRPAHLEKITEAPVPEVLVVDGDRLELQTDGDAKQTVALAAQPAIRALVDAIRGTLAGDIATMRRAYSVAMTGDAASWRLVLAPSDPAVARLVREVTVEGNGTDVHLVRMVQANGDESRMVITPVR